MYQPSFEFYDQSLLDDIRRGNPHTQEFFRLLAVCHTVMPELKDGKKLLQIYNLVFGVPPRVSTCLLKLKYLVPLLSRLKKHQSISS
jgi:hypothetical protein